MQRGALIKICIHSLKKLKKEIEKPELSEREEYLFTLVQSGKLEEMDNIFSNSSVDHCPFCLQTINENYTRS